MRDCSTLTAARLPLGGSISIPPTSGSLRDVRELALSLGYRATLVTKHADPKRPRLWPLAYRVLFTTSDDVFRLGRKREHARVQRSSRHNPERTRFRYVVDVRPVPSRPVRCITVDSPSSLFLAGEAMVPTHNTMAANVMLGAVPGGRGRARSGSTAPGTTGCSPAGCSAAGGRSRSAPMTRRGRDQPVGRAPTRPRSAAAEDRVPDRRCTRLMMGADGSTATERAHARLGDPLPVYARGGQRWRLKPPRVDAAARSSSSSAEDANARRTTPELAGCVRAPGRAASASSAARARTPTCLTVTRTFPRTAPLVDLRHPRAARTEPAAAGDVHDRRVRAGGRARAPRHRRRLLTSRARRPDVRRTLDPADRRAWHREAQQRDRRVRQRPRAPRPSSGADPRRALSAALAGGDTEHGHALLQNATIADAAGPAPQRAGVRCSGALQLSDAEDGDLGRPPRDGQGQPRPDAVDQRHPRTRTRLSPASARPSTGPSPPTRAATPPAARPRCASTTATPGRAIHELATGANGGVQ